MAAKSDFGMTQCTVNVTAAIDSGNASIDCVSSVDSLVPGTWYLVPGTWYLVLQRSTSRATS